MSHYSKKANARRAATAARIDPETVRFFQTDEGWTWAPIDATAASAELPAADAAVESFEDAAPARTAKTRAVRPHRALGLIRPDQIAECWEGVSPDLCGALWAAMAHVPLHTGETPPEPDIGAVSTVWQHFTQDQQRALNALAKARNAAQAKNAPPAPPARRDAPRGAWLREGEERAEAGALPPVPDFSAATHAPYRKKLAALVHLAETGDIAGLRAVEIKPYSSSPKAMARYRDLCVKALENAPREDQAA
ncbi:MAG: hypothetical protein IPK66_08185 [Rhodospirillales bacterium]|nr:hypothetical protein [Rhodospirillales bacterium]